MRKLLASLALLAATGCSLTIDPDGVEPPVVTKTVQSIAVTAAGALTVPKGATVQLAATATYTDATTGDVTAQAAWSSGATGVATVGNTTGAKGLVTAAAATGTATITATLQGVAGATTVTAAPAAVVSIAVTPATASVVRGLTRQLTATATYTDATTGDVTSQATWTSAAGGVVAVSDLAGTKGLATAVAIGGPVTLTAAFGGRSGTAAVTVTMPTVTSLAVTPATGMLEVGGTVQLTATATLSDTTTEDVTALAAWTSSAPGVASVNDTTTKGLVSGVAGGGPATVTATYQGQSDTASISVTTLTVQSIAVTPAAPSVARGASVQLTATATYSDGTTTADVTGQATWTSASPAVATVSDVDGTKGRVTAVADSGTSGITASLAGRSGTATVTATAAEVVSIAVTPATTSLPKGATQQLVATATYTDATTLVVTANAATTWTSSAPAVATVSTTGLVTAAAATGSATLTATFGGKSGTATVSAAAAAVSSVSVTPASASVAIGATQQLTATATLTDGTTPDVTALATWTSSAPTVATVSAAGLVTGVASSGNTTVTAAYGGKSGTATITGATKTLTSIAVAPSSLDLSVGEVDNLTATALYSDASTADVTASATWTSSAPGVAQVSSTAPTKGRVTAVSPSATPVTITAAYLGRSGAATVNVSAASVASIAITPAAPETAVGGKVQLTATATYTDTTTQDVTALATWSSGTAGVATVDDGSSKGLVTGVSAPTGTATASISATYGGQVATKIVTVRAVASIAVSPSTATVSAGTTTQLAATATLTGGGTQVVTEFATWTSGATGVATVSDAAGTKGRVTAVAQSGTAVISATLGATGTATITASSPLLVSIALSGYGGPIPNGTTDQLAATGTYSDATTGPVTGTANWSSLNTAVATVDNGSFKGVVTAKASTGTAVIRATIGSVFGELTVAVAPPIVSTVAVTPTPVSVAKGLTRQLVATATLSDGTSSNVASDPATVWSGGNSIVSVSTTGLVKGESVGGPVTITATFGGKSGSAQVTTTPAELVSLAIAPSSVSLPQGDHRALTATGTYTDGSTLNHTAAALWTVNAATFATVGDLASNKGVVTAVAPGSTFATAAFGGKSATCAVTVTPAAIVSVQIVLRNDMMGGGPGAPYVSPDMPLQPTTPIPAMATARYSTGATLDVTNLVAWSSTDETVVTVSNAAGTRGEVTTVAGGAATISASIAGVTGSLGVTVRAPFAIWIAPFPSELGIPVGIDTAALKAVALLDDWSFVDITRTATWSTSDAGTVTVKSGDPDGGKVSGVAPGSAMVTASLGGLSGAAAVIVKSGTVTLTTVSIFPSPLTLPYGENRNLTALAEYSDGTAYDVTELVTWTSDSPAVVTVDWEGQVEAQLPSGTAIISGTYPGYAGPIAVNVTVIPGWWFNIYAPPPIPPGQKLQLKAYVYDYETGQQIDVADYLTWTSLNPTIADFLAGDPPGVVTASTIAAETGTQVEARTSVGGMGQGWISVTQTFPTGLTISPAAVTAPLGGKAHLSAQLAYGAMGAYEASSYATWTSSNPASVTVNEWGNIEVVGAGGATITASLFGLSASTVVTVDSRTIQSIAISPASLVVDAGASVPVAATATLLGGGTLDVTPFVSWNTIGAGGVGMLGWVNPAVGTFQGNQPGTGQLVAMWGALTATASVEVRQPTTPQTLWMNATSSYAYFGTPIQYTLYADFGPGLGIVDVTEQAAWSLDVASAGTLSNMAGSKGLFTGGATAATVYATVTASYGALSTNYSVTVYPGILAGLRLSVSTPWTLKVGQQLGVQLYGDLVPPCAGPCSVDLTQFATWTSSNPEIASVKDEPGQKGLVTAHRRDIGSTATITADYPGWAPVSASATIFYPALGGSTPSFWIRNLDPWFDPSPWNPACQSGSTWSWTSSPNSIFDVRYVACATFDNGRTVDVTDATVWSTNAPAIASVSNAAGAKGLVSTHAPGPVTIQADWAGNFASHDVTVNTNTLTRLINDGGVLLAHVGVEGGGWGPNLIRARALYTGDTQEYEVTRYVAAVSRDTAIATVGALVDDFDAGLPVIGIAPGSTLVDAYYRGYTFAAPVTVDNRPFQAAQLFVDSSSVMSGFPWFFGTPQLGTEVPSGLPVRLQLGAFDAIGLPWTASELATWSSSNPACATVSNAAGSRGLVTTLSPGYTTITGTVDGVSASFDVEVTAATLTSFRLDRWSDVAPTGVTLSPFYATASYSDGRSYDVSRWATWPNGPYAAWTGEPGEYRVAGAGTSDIVVSFAGATAPLVIVGF